MIRSLFPTTLALVVLASSCRIPGNTTAVQTFPNASAGKTTIGYLDGVAGAVAKNESALGVALAGGFIKFSLESLKDWLSAKATSYEFKSKANRTIYVSGFDEADKGSFPYHSIMSNGGILLVARSVEVSTDDTGAVEGAYGDLVLSAVDKDGNAAPNKVGVQGRPGPLAKDALASLAPWSVASDDGTHASDWMVAELVRCGKLKESAKSKARVLSFAALVVVQKGTVTYSLVDAAPSTKADDKTLQLVLAGYTYPVPQVGQKSFSGSKKLASRIASVLTLGLEGPAGTETGPMGKYSASALFPVKSDLARGKALGAWVANGTNPPTSPAFSVPHSKIVGVSGVLVETSRLKKTLERLSKLVGSVSLTPADLGID